MELSTPNPDAIRKTVAEARSDLDSYEEKYGRRDDDWHHTIIRRLADDLESLLALVPEPPTETHRPGDEIDGTVYCSCGDGDYGSEGHRPTPTDDERDALINTMIGSDALHAGLRTEAMLSGSSQREPFLMFADAILEAGFRRPRPLDRSEAEAIDVPTREVIEEEMFKHSPILSMHDGHRAGCSCMDRVFIRGTESWEQHMADVAINAVLPWVARAVIEGRAS